MYIRERRQNPNKCYSEIQKDEVKYLFDTLHDNGIDQIKKETGFSRYFVSKTISEYIDKNVLNTINNKWE